ncbi:hypothetical protein CB0940_06060 [Cercospora beticola]|uniref:Uncharacterized protein n=1 Tax=Cercospora beticola TaxID=122368 RepID=A0A2G5HXQ5_CERBT|nr:hypothetical protein CB0940_06060 [Cercospora beticola]PIA97281.1 hypothetical protein CB0940_06060 [Cercospora beticola]WPA98673.1 hypothetical protein RHO25_003286 [Cercospora beticola]
MASTIFQLLAAFAVLNTVVPVAAQGNYSSDAIPIALGGKEAKISKEFIELMAPDYKIVHVIHSASDGKSEFGPLLAGEATIPVSGLGSNINNPSPEAPWAIFIGGGFAASEINEMYGSSLALQTVPWLYPPTTARANGTVVPPTAMIVERVKAIFREHGLVPGNGTKPAGGIWSF